MGTSEASVARRMSNGPPVAGVGKAEQNTVMNANGTIDGRGGRALLNTTGVGTFSLLKPEPNAVSLKITDNGGHAHTVTGPLVGGTTLTWDGNAGSFAELFASNDAVWELVSWKGVALT
jgi:hypothetical protein